MPTISTSSTHTIGGSQPLPRVTIGMPVHNGAEFLEQALAAIVGQTYRNYTLIVSDNASTDVTWKILQAWAARDDRIVLHRQHTDIGMARNLRYVLDQADGDYFMWQAHDDWRPPNHLAELVTVITAEPGCAAACSGTLWVSPDGTPIRQEPFPDLTGMSRWRRVTRMLWHASGSWFYGLFRTEDLRKAQAMAETFGDVWGRDRMLTLWFILNDQIRGTNQTVFRGCKTYQSSRRYRPKTLIAWFRFIARYLGFHVRFLWLGKLSPGEKIRCLPWVIGHAAKTSSLASYRSYDRFVRRPLERLVKRPAKHLLEAVILGPIRSLRK